MNREKSVTIHVVLLGRPGVRYSYDRSRDRQVSFLVF